MDKIFDNGEPIIAGAQDSDFLRWYNDKIRTSPSYKVLRRGDEISFDRVVVSVLSPTPSLTSDWNTNSIVMRIEYGKFSALLMGDGNTSTEEFLKSREKSLKATILKVGHHGASDTGSFEFIKSVSPAIALVSVNKNNIRGYPSAEVIHRFLEAHAQIIKTSDEGTISFCGHQDGSYERIY